MNFKHLPLKSLFLPAWLCIFAFMLLPVAGQQTQNGQTFTKVIVLPPGIQDFTAAAKETRAFKNAFVGAFTEGLKTRYAEVFSGRDVEKKMAAIYADLSETSEKECTEESCRPALKTMYGTSIFATLEIIRGSSNNVKVTVTVFEDTDGGGKQIYFAAEECAGCSDTETANFITQITRRALGNTQGGQGGNQGGIVIGPQTPQQNSSGQSTVKITGSGAAGQATGGKGFVILNLTSEPAGATVYINGVRFAETPISIDKNLVAGQITLELKKDRYRDYKNQNFVLKSGFNGEDISPVKLVPAFGRLSVTGQPAGAEVFLAGKKIGSLPLNNVEIDSDSYIMEIKADLHRTLQKRIKIEDGKPYTEKINLQPNFGTVSIRAEPSDAKVAIFSGDKKIKTIQLPATFKLSPGAYQGEISKTGYDTLRFDLNVVAGKKLELKPDQAKLRSFAGTLAITTDPYRQGATVSINGKTAGKIPLSIDYPAGPVEITVTDGTLSGKNSFTLADRETRTVKIKLEKGSSAGVAGAEGMVLIKGGCFRMGSPAGEKDRDDDERQHEVCVKDFFIGKYEVTAGEFAECVKAGGCDKPRTGDNCTYGVSAQKTHPINCVSWYNALKYTQWQSKKTGRTFRLPTEAEWEYAARGGTTTRFFWGDDNNDSQICRYANVHDKTSKNINKFDWTNADCDDGFAQTAPVGSFKPNAYGLYDTSGNVWEWTCSERDKGYGGKETLCNNDANDDALRSLRGGSWLSRPRFARSAKRIRNSPVYRLNGELGFRLAGTP